MAAAFSSSAQTNYQRLHAFGPSEAGSTPRGAIIQGSDSLLYGITYDGGTNGWGSIYRIAPDGSNFGIVHHFASPTVFPVAGLVEKQGVLYGTVPTGGTAGSGVVFRVGANGADYATIHEFNPAEHDGEGPVAGLLAASDGYFYGTAASGGSNNLGIIFRMGLDGSDYTRLHHFDGTGGSFPSAALIEGHDGALYGIASAGGTGGFGVVFRILKSGDDYTVLRNFQGATQNDGREPMAELLQASDGVLYGSTYRGGNSDVGTLFRVNTNGADYAVIYHCQHNIGNGARPVSGLKEASNGLLYGTMPRGGNGENGIVFRIGKGGTDFEIIHRFGALSGDGTQPYAALLIAEDGSFYGTSSSGGVSDDGVIYKLFSGSAAGRFKSVQSTQNGIVLNFELGAAGKVYNIQRSTGLTPPDWQGIGSSTALIDGSFEFTDSGLPPGTVGFYRASSE